MGGCSILGCHMRTEKNKDRISFHSFPSDHNLCKKWIDATGRQNWRPTKHARLCSIHFDVNCFSCKKKLTHLKPFAIPTKYLKNMNIEIQISQCTTKRKPRILRDVQTKPKQIVNNPASGSVNIISAQSSPLLNTGLRLRFPEQPGTFSNIALTPTASCDLNDIVCPSGRASHNATSGLQSPFENFSDPLTICSAHYGFDSMNKSTKPTDRTYDIIQRKLEKQKQISANLLKKLRAARESRRRLSTKVAKLENILLDLKRKITQETEVLRGSRKKIFL